MPVETKYQIFVSSTFRELEHWRKALIDQILRTEHIPSGMEGFSAADEEELKVIKRAIDQCDIYTVVIGSTFGSAIPDTTPNESFTQREFRYASEQGKPILAFILHDDDFEAERDGLPAESNERKHEEFLRQFRTEVTTIEGNRHRIVEFFRKSEGVHGLTARFGAALGKLINSPTFNMPGWVRLPPGVGTNPFIQRIMLKLSGFDKLSYRCTLDYPSTKAAMAKHFWYRFGAEVHTKQVWHLYFESGSTVAYVAERFRQMLREEAAAWESHRADLRIHTNNILTYLEFTLYERLQLALVPHGPPDDNDKYGATFGSLLECPELSHPVANIPLSRADKKGTRLVESLSKQVVPASKPSLILATASGLEQATASEFPGPHVGTYRNKLLKRALLRSRHPVVLFFDHSKISPYGPKGAFKVGSCHPVCDPDFSWEMVVKENPLCLCVGADNDEAMDKIVKLLESQGAWKAETPRDYDGKKATLLVNAQFWNYFGKSRTNSNN
ncbi:MAG: DUF4062 domain-containing protein [Planctomycetaceae bacterium]|nr:DUF4062 domain-containing protein [Planctomycetaceae bacterium]